MKTTEPVADTLSSMTAQLLSPPFVRDTPAAQVISDPLVDTPMQVPLEQIQPYHLNPRRSPNPQYDAIKASIRQRGLDQPPNITRRPGEEHFIIRNGGNTRLAILNELWLETGEERFHNLLCLFRPWTARGEILALTGHLAENELRSNLTYIERSQAVDQARQLYEQECGHSLNQSELATRLTEDGYPVTQPSISRMRATLEHLLPAIPGQLHAGLGRPQIEKLLSLHKAAQRAWERHASDAEFAPVFQESLTRFDSDEIPLSIERVRDELIGDLAQQLTLDYDELALEMGESDLHRNLLGQLLEPEVPLPLPESGPRPTASVFAVGTSSSKTASAEQLRSRIAELARTITAETAPDIEVLVQLSGYGFACHCANPESLTPRGQALLLLLQTLTGNTPTNTKPAADLGSLFCGGHAVPFERLSDETLNQLFRLIKLMRLLPLDNPPDSSP
ncbi:ParB family protein [Pseudomonas sp. MWU12-2037]|uniref:ParB family protein n=1 Tax=Pseudomonas sp. MWU12-2037 TaxID=2928690 RepID=UPI0032C47B7D